METDGATFVFCIVGSLTSILLGIEYFVENWFSFVIIGTGFILGFVVDQHFKRKDKLLLRKPKLALNVKEEKDV